VLQKIVAHLIDHTIIKGTSGDVDPKRPLCHVQTQDRGMIAVDLREVKALYFVKDFGGRPGYDETHVPVAGDPRLRGSKPVEIHFKDGERMGALVNRYPPLGPFFFVLPLDPHSNNVRILVNREATASIQARDQPAHGPAEEAGPQRIGLSEPAPRPKRSSWVFDGKDIKKVPIE
jgi:hypothetical protein